MESLANMRLVAEPVVALPMSWHPAAIVEPLHLRPACRRAGSEEGNLVPVGHRFMEPGNQHVPDRVVEPVSHSAETSSDVR